MNEQNEHPETAPAESTATRAPVRMCVRCGVITDMPVVVSVVHQNTGPGFSVYSCRECAPHFPRVPDVLSLLPPRKRAEGER